MAQAQGHFTNSRSLKCSIESIYLLTLLNLPHCEMFFLNDVFAFFPNRKCWNQQRSDHTDSRWFKIFFVNVDWNSYGNKQTMNQNQRAAMTVWYTVTIYYIIPSRDQSGGWEPDLCWYKNKDCQGWSGFTQRWWVMNHQQIEHHCFPPVSFTSWMMVR